MHTATVSFVTLPLSPIPWSRYSGTFGHFCPSAVWNGRILSIVPGWFISLIKFNLRSKKKVAEQPRSGNRPQLLCKKTESLPCSYNKQMFLQIGSPQVEHGVVSLSILQEGRDTCMTCLSICVYLYLYVSIYRHWLTADRVLSSIPVCNSEGGGICEYLSTYIYLSISISIYL